jgi:hypothetical protein
MGPLEVYRYERKYVVPERAAQAISQFVACYLPPDEHMEGVGPEGYRVCSLYLDTPDLGLYDQTRRGIKNRYKLRIRFYDELEESPAFLEVKKRTTETVHKLRAVVPKPAAEHYLRGGLLSDSDLLMNGDAGSRALSDFCACRERLHAEGVAFVDYRRVAYVSRSAERTRVTLDRHIVGHSYDVYCGLKPPMESSPAVSTGVVLELKYNGRAPRWMQDIVRTFNLERRSFPKYVYCVNALRIDPEHRVPGLRRGGRGVAELLARSARS